MLPRLLMPNSFCLPPGEYCRGTTPSQAAKSRPRRKAAPLPMAATVAVETSGPKPGFWRSRRHPLTRRGEQTASRHLAFRRIISMYEAALAKHGECARRSLMKRDTTIGFAYLGVHLLLLGFIAFPTVLLARGKQYPIQGTVTALGTSQEKKGGG